MAPAVRLASAGAGHRRGAAWLALAAVCLCPAPASALTSDITGPPYKPGDSHYWVKLRSLEVSEGVLQPPFQQDRDNYEVHVRNTYSTALVMTLGLKLQMYNLMQCPQIFVDGKEVVYSPLNLLSVVIELNETIGPFDKTVNIQVADPHHGTWWSPTNSMTYRIHFTQPPEFEKILEVSSIAVRDSTGQVIQGQPPFRPGSFQSSYHYDLKEAQTSVNVEVACSDMATGMVFDEEPWNQGTVKTINMRHLVEWKSLVHCKYYDPVWTPTEETRTYALSFSRATTLSEAPPKLTMLADYGYCEPRSAYEAQLGKVLHNVSSTEGFVCVSDKEWPRIMVNLENEDAEVYILSPDRKNVIPMPSYLPTTIHNLHERQEFLLRKHAGSVHREYPIILIWPSGCSSMACPEHYVLRRTIRDKNVAARRMCLQERCSLNDVGVCCTRLAACASLECPLGKQPTADAHTAECGGPVCGEEDIPHCCENQATCAGYHCPAHMVLRSGAAATYCGDSECGTKDEARCCEERAPCGSYRCPVGSVHSNSEESRFCRSSVCEKEDEPHCCQAHAKCSTFVCPAGKQLRKGAEGIKCYGATCANEDVDACCHTLPSVSYKKGLLQSINDDGSYSIRFDSGKVDEHVPEWALRGGQDHSNLHPGERVEAVVGQDGYEHRKYVFGWVRQAHSDRTYSVEYESGEVDRHVPVWALRAVDEQGHLFVHSELFAEGERVIASRTHKGYHKEDFRIASVIKVNNDGTYTVRYASGLKDEHVPKWDVRAIDSRGRSYAKSTHNVGDNVEVNLGAKAKGVQIHKDQLRTKYLLGRIAHANADGTYEIQFDFGGVEDNVPNWAMRFLDRNMHSTIRSRFFVGDRVEARISMDVANNLTGWGMEALGIATREKVVLYRNVNCWPAATKCGPMPVADKVPKHPKPPEVPPLSDYDVVNNPDGAELCYYDETCSATKELGCNHETARPNCRFCGFGNFPKCPRPFDCSKGLPGTWPSEQKEWCCSNYNVGCPYECRWGKWWPDEANGWGPWWTEQKRKWCCENQNLGCPIREEPAATPKSAAPRPDVAGQRPPASGSDFQADSDGEWEVQTGHHQDTESTASDLAFKYEADQQQRQRAEFGRPAAAGALAGLASAALLALGAGLTLRRRALGGTLHCRPQQRNMVLDCPETDGREEVPLIP